MRGWFARGEGFRGNIAIHIATRIASPMASIIAMFEPYRRSMATHKTRRAANVTEMKMTASAKK
jgi:hypothetical protein